VRLGLPFRHPAALLATWFGIGLVPVMPGSLASLAALPCAWAIDSLGGMRGLAIAIGIVTTIGCWAAAKAAASSAVKDPGWIVIDEVAGQWLALLPAPLDPLFYALGFLLFRLFDTWKPWPVGWADRHIQGGLGVMLDDLLAAVYAALALSVLRLCGDAFGVRR
jgi:phosphatidylglycerophosphatase A